MTITLMDLYTIYKIQHLKIEKEIKDVKSCLEKLNKIQITTDQIEKCKREFWNSLKELYSHKKELDLLFKKVLNAYGY